MEENKTHGKEGEDEGVFFRFRDDLAVDNNSHRAGGIRRKIGRISFTTSSTIDGSRKEVADGFVQNTRTRPSRGIPCGIGQSASGDANPYVVVVGIIVHEKMGNASAAAGDGDGRRVGGIGGKSDVGSAASRNSGSHRNDVVSIRAGKQGRELNERIAGFIGIVKVSVKIRRAVPTERSKRACLDVAGGVCGGGAAKNPEGLVGGVVLAGIDVDEQLRLALFNRRQRKQSRRQKNTYRQPLAGCSLFAVRCSLFAVRCSLFAVRCSLFAVRCSLFAVRCSLFAVRCSLFSFFINMLKVFYNCQVLSSFLFRKSKTRLRNHCFRRLSSPKKKKVCVFFGEEDEEMNEAGFDGRIVEVLVCLRREKISWDMAGWIVRWSLGDWI